MSLWRTAAPRGFAAHAAGHRWRRGSYELCLEAVVRIEGAHGETAQIKISVYASPKR